MWVEKELMEQVDKRIADLRKAMAIGGQRFRSLQDQTKALAAQLNAIKGALDEMEGFRKDLAVRPEAPPAAG